MSNPLHLTMSSIDPSKEMIHQELLNIEIKAYSTYSLFQKTFVEGMPLEKHFDIMMGGSIFQNLEQKAQLLNSAKESSLESEFLLAKSATFEAQRWIELLIDYYTKQAPGSYSQTASAKAEEAFAVLHKILKNIDSFLPHVAQIRKKRLATDFQGSLASLQSSLHQMLFHDPEPFNQERLPFKMPSKEQIYKTTLLVLHKAAEFVLAHREEWEGKLLAGARSLYIPPSEPFPFPFLYSKEGSIYVLQEIVSHLLGWGSGKHVSRTFELQSGKIWALIRPWTHGTLDTVKFTNAWRETLFLRKLKNAESIIYLQEAMIFYLEQKPSLFEICEFFPSISLEECMLGKKGKLSEEEKKTIAKELLHAVCCVHKEGIIHRDIKHENILISSSLHTKQQKTLTKLIDFNSACYQTETREKTAVCFSFPAAPPECAHVLIETGVLLNEELTPTPKLIPCITSKMDVWSLGCVFYMLFFEEGLPWCSAENFKEPNPIKLVKEISDLKEDWLDDSYQSRPFYPLIKKMMSIDPEKRPSIEEALQLFEKLSS